MTTLGAFFASAEADLPSLFADFPVPLELDSSFFATPLGEQIALNLRILEFPGSPLRAANEFGITHIFSLIVRSIHPEPPAQLAILTALILFFADSDFPSLQSDFEPLLSSLFAVISEKAVADLSTLIASAARALSRFLGKFPSFSAPLSNGLKANGAKPVVSVLIRDLSLPATLEVGHRLLFFQAVTALSAAPPSPALSEALFRLAGALGDELPVQPGDLSAIKGIVYFTLLSKTLKDAAELRQRFPEILALVEDGRERSLALELISGIITGSPADVAVIPDLLKTVATQLPAAAPADAAALASVLSAVHQSSPDALVSAVAASLQSGAFSALTVRAIVDFAASRSLALGAFVPADTQQRIALAKLLAVSARKCMTSPALSAFLQLILAVIAALLAAPPKEKIDMQAELSQFLSSGQVEQSLSYHKIERLCYLAFHAPTPAVRLLAYEVLSRVGEAFERENDDWENYEPSLQAFIRQFNTDLSVFAKKNFPAPIAPAELLGREDERGRALAYLSRRLGVSRQPWARKAQREALEGGRVASFLFDAAGAQTVPQRLKKMGAKVAKASEVIRQAVAAERFAALRFTHAEFVREALEGLAAASDPSPAFLEGISEAPLQEPAALTPEIITLELQCLRKHALVGAAGVVRNLALQALEAKVAPRVPEFATFFAEAPAHADDPAVLAALVFIGAVALKADGEPANLRAALALSGAADTTVVAALLRRAGAASPDHRAAILGTAIPAVPTAAALVLLEAAIPALRPITVLALQLASPAHPQLLPLAQRFARALLPDTPPEGLASHAAIVAAIIAGQPDLAPSVLAAAEEIAPGDSEGRLLDALLPWFPALKSELPRFVRVAAVLTHGVGIPGPSVSTFWERILSDQEIAPAVFTALIDSGASLTTLDFVRALCPTSVDVRTCLTSLMGTRAAGYIADGHIASFTTLARFVLRIDRWLAATVLAMTIAVQLPDLAISRDALSCIKQVIPQATVEVPLLELVQLVCATPSKESCRRDVLKFALGMIGSARGFTAFAALARIITAVVASYMPGSKMPTVEAAFLPLVEWYAREGSVEVFADSMAVLYESMATVVAKPGFPQPFFDFLVAFGVAVADLGIRRLNAKIAGLLSAAAPTPLVPALPLPLLRRVVELIDHGDELYETITTDILPIKAVESIIENPVTAFWRRVMDGTALMPSDARVLESIMKSLAFGGTLMLEKVAAVLYRTGSRKEDQHGHFTDFIRFLLMSPELAPTVVVPLVNITDAVIGSESGQPGIPITLFRSGLADVAQALSARH
jgi:hypothetical protein